MFVPLQKIRIPIQQESSLIYPTTARSTQAFDKASVVSPGRSGELPAI